MHGEAKFSFREAAVSCRNKIETPLRSEHAGALRGAASTERSERDRWREQDEVRSGCSSKLHVYLYLGMDDVLIDQNYTHYRGRRWHVSLL